MPMNLLLRTPERFLQQAVVPSVNTRTVALCVYVCGWGYPKAVPLAWQRLITHTASFFAPKRGAAPLAGPSRQGDPTCPRMAGRQAGRQAGGREGGCSLCLYCAGATERLLVHRGPGWFQTAACVPVSKQLISFFNTQLPQHQAQVKVTSLACWRGLSKC